MINQYICSNDLCPEKYKIQEFVIENTDEVRCSFCRYILENTFIDKQTNSNIDGPEHYGGYQVLELICSAGYGKGFCLGNALKYLSRAQKKDDFKEDLLKAQAYLNYYIENELEKGGS